MSITIIKEAEEWEAFKKAVEERPDAKHMIYKEDILWTPEQENLRCIRVMAGIVGLKKIEKSRDPLRFDAMVTYNSPEWKQIIGYLESNPYAIQFLTYDVGAILDFFQP